MRKILSLLLTLSIVSSVSAKVIFVSTDGTDENSGTKFSPLKTIQSAIDKALPGDIIMIEEGSYNESLVISSINSDPEKPLIIKALGKVILSNDNIKLDEGEVSIAPLETPISDPKHPYHPYFHGAIIRIDHSENVEIDGITVVNSSWFGISVFNSSSIKIENCKVDNTGASGIYVLKSTNVSVIGNEVTRACAFPNRLPNSGHGTQECISVIGSKNFEVAYNEVHEPGTYAVNEDGGTGSGGEGIDIKEEGTENGSVHHNYVYNLNRIGIYCDAWNGVNYKNIEVYSNVVHDCTGGFGVAGEAGGQVKSIKFYNNLVFNVENGGFGLSTWGINGVKSNIHFYNNTLYNCKGYGIELGNQNHDSLFVYNNIAFGNGPSVEKKIDDSDIAYEGLSYKKIEKESSTGDFSKGTATNVFMKGNLFGVNPEFIDPSNLNFRLSEKSPAIDIHKGFQTPSFDLNDQPRKVGKKVDAGAFEFQKK